MKKEIVTGLIEDNRFKEAIDLLKKETRDTYLYNQVILLSASHEDYLKLEITGVEDFSVRSQRACIRFLDRQTGWIGTYTTKVGGPAFYKWNGGGILSDIKVIEAEDIALKISPNPTSRYLTVEHSAAFKPTSLIIFDATGKTVLEKKNDFQSVQTIDLQDLKDGMYFLQMQNREGVVAAQKIVVAK